MELPGGNEGIRIVLHPGHDGAVRGRAGSIGSHGGRRVELLVEGQREGADNDATTGVELVDRSVQSLSHGEGADEPGVRGRGSNTLGTLANIHLVLGV